MRRALAIAAIVASFWPLPIGLGYLFLREWARFVIVLVAITLGQSLLARIIGWQPAGAVTLGLWILTVADTFRIALPVAKGAA